MWRVRSWDFLLCVLFFFMLSSKTRAAWEEELDPDSLYQPCQHHNPLMNATHERFRGQDVVWQIPENPRAVLFLGHGGEGTPLNFFDFGHNCRLCYGLPEQRIATLDALKNGYAVVTLKSTAARWDVWPLDTSRDIDIVVDLLKTWMKEHSLEALPIVAWGFSMGGELAMSLTATHRLPIRAIVVMCAARIKRQVALANAQFPPTKFVYFTGRGSRTGLPSEAEVEDVMSILADRGVSVSRIRCLPKPLSPSFLTQRVHCVTHQISKQIFEQIRAESLLDGDNYLIVDPSDGAFEDVLWRSHAVPFCTRRNELCLAPDVVEELSVAYGYHTFVSDANGEIFSWLDSTLGLAAQDSFMPVVTE